MSAQLDKEYPTFRHLFEVPTLKSLNISPDTNESTYLCGNSLGLMPKSTRKAINDELDTWAQQGVEGHFSQPERTPWVDIDLPLLPLVAPIVGAKESEVAVMGSLTSNLNAMLMSFYKPKGKRTKILFEKHAFPSDYYAFSNIVQLFGYDESHLIQVAVQDGATYLRTEDIIAEIEKNANELALVCFPGIQYYTGQFFDIKKITKAAQDHGICVGWDLAHAVGNVPLHLHDWNVDFAVWCSYKYLNSGPGAMAGIYVHQRHTQNNSKTSYNPRLAGWWGNNAQERFQMKEEFNPINSALSYRQSNPSVIDTVAVKASLEVFQEANGIQFLREKSIKMTQFLQDLLTQSQYYIKQDEKPTKIGFQILTPLDPHQRGCQLSLLFHPHYDDKSQNIMEQVNKYLHNRGIVCDERRPDVIRVAPTPLYNTFAEIEYAVNLLNEALNQIKEVWKSKAFVLRERKTTCQDKSIAKRSL